MIRKILHADCDCFYAAIEMRENPYLSELPLAIGGLAKNRGVIATCNYIARSFGIRSAMPTIQALKLCPKLVLLPPNFPLYRQVSEELHRIFQKITDRIEPLSLDEAFLDVTEVSLFNNSATRIAYALKEQVKKQLGITISVGVACNKFLAKIASDWRKPDGLFVIHPKDIAKFVANLDIHKLPGVGPATAAKLHHLHIFNGKDLQQQSLDVLIQHFGKYGTRLYELSRGIDERLVETESVRKSLSVEVTFAQDLTHWEQIAAALKSIIETFNSRYQKQNKPDIIKLFVKLRFQNFTQTTLEQSTQTLEYTHFETLIHEAWQRRQLPVRLLGIGVKLKPKACVQQLELFELN